jgi:hypothetical protein
LLIPIPNPKKIWLAEQEEMKTQLQLQQQLQEEEEVTIMIDTIGDRSLKSQEEDYIAFLRVDSNVDSDTSASDSGELGELELYDPI